MGEATYKIKSFLLNWRTVHHRMMMRFLRKREWVVFYLDKQARFCSEGECWLTLYNQTT